jgi:replicative DNA helicase
MNTTSNTPSPTPSPPPSGGPLERTPPHNLEAEMSVLGSCLIDPDAIIKIADKLKPEDFYKEAHGKIYAAMLELYERREPIDVLAVTNKLKEQNTLEEVGGAATVTSLAAAVPTAGHVMHYAQIVQRKATLRRLISVAAEITTLGFEEDADVEETLDKAEQKLFSISQKYLRPQFAPIKKVLEETFARIDELHRGEGSLRGIPTGFRDLDNYLAGLQRSDLIILASRPSLGKTTLALDIARHVAVEEKVPVGIFSLEMSKEQLVDRLLCAQARVDLWRMRTGKLSAEGENDDFSRIGVAMGVLSEAPIYIDDSATNNVMEMRTLARRLQAEHGVGLIIIDYLQLMAGSRAWEGRVQEVSEISRALKNLARELNIPVLALSQLSRAVESRSPQIPRLADLRESGSIEQDADVVLFIYREDKEKPDTERQNIADIVIAKHRNGPTGSVELYFDEEIVSFSSVTREHAEEEVPAAAEEKAAAKTEAPSPAPAS